MRLPIGQLVYHSAQCDENVHVVVSQRSGVEQEFLFFFLFSSQLPSGSLNAAVISEGAGLAGTITLDTCPALLP